MSLMNEKLFSKYKIDISNTWNSINKSLKCKKQTSLPETFTQNDTFYDNVVYIASGFNEYLINIPKVLLSDMDRPSKITNFNNYINKLPPQTNVFNFKKVEED